MSRSATAQIAKRMDALPLMQAAHLMDALIVAFAVLGALGIIYVVGIEHTEALHNAFHNVRHACAFPCH